MSLKKYAVVLLLICNISLAEIPPIDTGQVNQNQITASMYTLPQDAEVLSITVKFIEGSGIKVYRRALSFQTNERLADGVSEAQLVSDISKIESMLFATGYKLTRTIHHLSEAEVDQLRLTGENKIKSNLPDMNLYHTIWLPPHSQFGDVEQLVKQLNDLTLVQIAYADPKPVPPGHLSTPDYEPNQGYLQAPPNGINAELAWTYNNGKGQGVKIIDLEGNWSRGHEDLPTLFYDSGNDAPASGWRDHGTAVLGILGAVDNGYGVTGIANQAQLGVQTFGTGDATTPASIIQATSQLSAGDVLLIELQVAVSNQLLPVEYYQGSFDAILTATAAGIIVVEPAGNGSINLDDPAYNDIFDRTFRDSGAIMVAAGQSTQRTPWIDTNYGSRIDVHGWGQNVTTTGYGNLFNGGHNDHNRYYTATFNGTSSASPIVAGAVAIIQSIATDLNLPVLDPSCMRDLLVSTGTNQTGDLTKKIGPLPDLGQAIPNINSCNGPSPTITLARTIWGNRYAIELQGNNFGSNATVEVRAGTRSNTIIDTYSGHFIYNSSDVLLRFPIVEPSQQAVLRGDGLCFKVVNSLGTSNEVCTQRINDIQQGDFLGSPVESYTTGQDKHFEAYIVKGGGTVMKLFGNSWKKVAFNYDITPNTQLEFNFKSTHQEPEIAGIGFIMNDGSGGGFNNRFWQIYGLAPYGIQDLNNYSGTQEVTYRIPVGQVLNGQLSHLVFVGDEDLRRGQNTVFLSPVFIEGIDQYDDVPSQRAYSDDAPGDAVPIFGNASEQIHNFHDLGDGDWTIFSMPNDSGFYVKTNQLGTASARMIGYRVDGAYTEISPGRWDITQSDLTHVADDFSNGNNSILLQNTTGLTQAYAIRTFSSGPYGNDTNYSIQLIPNNPVVEVDAYDDVPSQRAYSDDAPGDGVPIFSGANAQIHNFHDQGDGDWTIFSMPNGSVDIRTTQLGAASAQMIAYRVDGAFTEISPGRWDITMSDLTHIADDFSLGNNLVTIQNTTGSIQAYVIRTFSSGPVGSGTNYSIRLTNNP